MSKKRLSLEIQNTGAVSKKERQNPWHQQGYGQ